MCPRSCERPSSREGWEVAPRHVVNKDATISAVNYSEVLQKASQLGVVAEDIDAHPDRLAITIDPVSRLDARLAASYYGHRSGLSLADRVCLALARSISSPACTAIICGSSGPTIPAFRSCSSADEALPPGSTGVIPVALPEGPAAFTNSDTGGTQLCVPVRSACCPRRVQRCPFCRCLEQTASRMSGLVRDLSRAYRDGYGAWPAASQGWSPELGSVNLCG